jgi:hypothetical protein
MIKNPAPLAVIKRRLNCLRSDTSGIALTEFALMLPVLCAVCITAVELANYAHSTMRVSQIALSVADNSGRIRDSIDEADVDAILIGAKLAGESIHFGSHGRVILSMVEHNGLTGSNAGQKMTWQRCFGMKPIDSSYGFEGDGATTGSHADGFGPAGNKISALPNDGLMFVEVVYDYQPVFDVASELLAGLAGKTVRYTAAFPVREREENGIANGFDLSNSERRLCSNYTAT